MRYLRLFTLIFGLIFFGCNPRTESKSSSDNNIEKTKLSGNPDNKEAIQNLIRQALNWANSENSIDLLPVISENGDSLYTGFDFKILKLNLNKLDGTGLFSKEFIDNYNQIILTLDKGIKTKEYDDWLVGEMQTFNFANDVNPWCYCQEIPDNNPNPWDLVKVTIIKLDEDKGDLTWTWGQTNWEDAEYSFRVIKENGRWKISYMKGFDYNESIKKG